ncbi:MAG: hypothetical protein K2Q01_03680, partial [Rickettsiales bacterium]|nr:hypothetical protein [Rickettsiales bacterium]
KWMMGDNQYRPDGSLGSQKNPLQFIAKLIDSTVSPAIEHTVTAVAGREAGLASVRFRPTRHTSMGGGMRGRSLGDESVNITFDFFCASVGDAWGRDIAGWIDPHVKKCWMDDKGNISVPKAVDAMTKSLTRYVTYNGGEDWAVAIPYAYFMKAQRSMIDKAAPGFKYDFDRSLNGGSFKVQENKVVGNYNLPGLLDLQSRFTAYNIGTLMYREVYNYVDDVIHGKAASLYGAPDQQKPHKTIGDKAGDLMKWAARSAVKGMIIMTPAVPFFWITRTPQTKHRGLFIDPDQGILGRPLNSSGTKGDSVYANTAVPSESTRVRWWSQHHVPDQPNLALHRTISESFPLSHFDSRLADRKDGSGTNRFNSYQRTFGVADSVLNAAGSANYKAAHKISDSAGWIDTNLPGVVNPVKEALGLKDPKTGQLLSSSRFIRPMVYASASYTPYMYAKAEFANLWDNGKMDLAAERMIDGALKFSWGEFKKGAGEVYNTVLQRPLSEPEREVEGQRRMLIDNSPPAAFLETQAQQEQRKKNAPLHGRPQAPQANWRDRVISAPAQEK